MNNTEARPLGYLGPYLERGGVGMRAMVEKLVEPPEYPLSEEGRQEVRHFANYDIHEMPVQVSENRSKTLEKILLDSDLAQGGMIFSAAFIGESGQDIAQRLGIGVPQMQKSEEVYAWLAQAVDSHQFDDELMQKISKASLDRYKGIMASALLTGESVDDRDLDMMAINFDPDLVLQSALELQATRRQLLSVRRDFYGHNNDIEGAKRAVADVYLAKLNTHIVSNLNQLVTVYEQAELTGNELLRDDARRLLGGFGHLVGNDDARSRTFTRLDYMKNGMGVDGEGVASPISAELEKVVGLTETETREPYFAPEQVAILRSIKVSPDRMKAGFENILAEADILSSEDSSTWSPKRRQRAADKKFQVVVQPTKTSFGVNGVDGTLKVPSAERSLYDVLVVGGFHELCHIDQSLADDEFAQQFKIGDLAGKRTGVLREPAANAQQRMAERRLFGKAKPVSNPTYMHSLQALRAGGSLADAARAFYTAKMVSTPGSSSAAAAAEAADRVLRLKRFHGYNSAPLSYAEEGVMVKELEDASPEVVKRSGAITSLDLVDQLKLHRYGLLPDTGDVSHDWTGLVFKEFYVDIEQALCDAGLPLDDTPMPQESRRITAG